MDFPGAVVQDGGQNFFRDATALMATTSTHMMPSPAETHPIPEAVLGNPLQTRATSLGNIAGFNASLILAAQQQHQIQAIASTFSSCSIFAAVCAVYWFCMMRRNFRRDLVLLLIIGDCWKSIWFLVFSSMSLANGLVPSVSSFCQASGYFLAVGFEACDIAILFMSLHMQLQIFPRKASFLGHDGLYRIRRYVLAAWVIIPSVVVSLAFTNTHNAFVSQGGFCSLPIRPFWYRLALSWIPRYLIWLYVMYIAIRIYKHVGYEFKVFAGERDGGSSFGVMRSSAGNTKPSSSTAPMQRTQSTQSDAAAAEKGAVADEDIAPEDDYIGPVTPIARPSSAVTRLKKLDSLRRQSVPEWSMPFGVAGLEHMETFAGPQSPRSKSNPSSRRGSRQITAGIGAEDFAPPPPLQIDQHRGSMSTMTSMKSATHSSYDPATPGLDTIAEQRIFRQTTDPNENAATRAMQQRRRAIQRQLRLLFIYPVIYLIMWVMPFVAHALNYNNHFAQHPIFAISILSVFCQVSMGYVDVIVFCWRERPWRHIPGSDGTFLGSLLFWRFAFGPHWSDQRRKSGARDLIAATAAGEEKSATSQSRLLSSLKRWSTSLSTRFPSPRPSVSVPAPPVRRAPPPMHRRHHSGGSDRKVMEAERAHERLAMERAEYQQNRRSMNERRASFVEEVGPLVPQEGPARKEWWDRHMSVGEEGV